MTVYVTQFQTLRALSNGLMAPALHCPQVADTEVMTPGAASTPSAPFVANANYVRIQTDSPIRINIGPNPNADNGWRMAANQTEVFGVAEGHKVAIKVSA